MSRSAEIVICGAGIAGTATAYHLAVRHGVKKVVIIDEREPLTLTSNKGTQGFRNWWPGPDSTMLRFVSRSIDILEEIARESDNAIQLAHRGYMFVTAQPEQVSEMRTVAQVVAGYGMGALREHTSPRSYTPRLATSFDNRFDGADLLHHDALLHHFPYLSHESLAALHIRRAGWVNAQRLGNWSLDRAVASGAEFIRDRISGVRVEGGRVSAVRLAGGSEIETGTFILCAGPLLHEAGRMLELELPVKHELHAKVTFRDVSHAVPRHAPFLIWTDGMRLKWNDDERKELLASGRDRRLLDDMPGGVHVRPVDGTSGDEIFLIWTYENEECTPVWPPVFSRRYSEALLRGVAAMVPAMARYVNRGAEGITDGGYYCKTRENRPLVGPLPVEGAFVCGALSGYGVMAAHGAADLIAAHVTGSTLPAYSKWFHPARYDDPRYLDMISGWNSLQGQL